MKSNTEEWNSWQTKKVPWVFPDYSLFSKSFPEFPWDSLKNLDNDNFSRFSLIFQVSLNPVSTKNPLLSGFDFFAYHDHKSRLMTKYTQLPDNFHLWVRAQSINGAESLEFVISDTIKIASVSTIWCCCCVSSLLLY